MTFKKQAYFSLVAAALSMAVISDVSAEEETPPAPPDEGIHYHMERVFPPPQMIKELSLSEDQLAKIKDIHEKRKEALDKARTNIREAHRALHRELGTEASEKDLRKKFEKVQDATQQMAKEHFEEVLSIRSVLTPEQRKKFESIAMEKRGKGWGKRGHRHEKPRAEEIEKK